MDIEDIFTPLTIRTLIALIECDGEAHLMEIVRRVYKQQRRFEGSYIAVVRDALKKLVNVGLVKEKKIGRIRYYKLNTDDPKVREIIDYFIKCRNAFSQEHKVIDNEKC